MAMAPSQLGCFTFSSDQHARPNIQYHVQPLSLDNFGDPLHGFNAFTASVCNLRPTSRGFVHISSLDIDAPPIIDPRYLSTAEDKQVAIESIRLTREIINRSSAFAPLYPEEYKPGESVQSTSELVKAAGDIGTTIFHPVGTCKMGTESDGMAVLDSKLRVIGVRGLRIADASAMPTITSGNTAAPTMMIAQCAADNIIAGLPSL